MLNYLLIHASREKTLLSVKFLLIFLCINCLPFTVHNIRSADTPLAALQHLAPNDLAGDLGVAVANNTRDRYNGLRLYQQNLLGGLPARNTNLRGYLVAINDFRISLHQTRLPFNPFTIQESNNLIRVLQSAYINIDNFINQYNPNPLLKEATRSLFNPTIMDIHNRYRLTKIEHAIRSGTGWMEENVIQNIPNGGRGRTNIFKNTIRRLTGRIFVVDPNNGNPLIISMSSGIIVPRQGGGAVRYDRIITCGHSMISNNTNPELIFYFIRSEALNLQTGLPNPIDIANVVGAHNANAAQANQHINTAHFIQYLGQESQNPGSNSVRRIMRFQAFHRQESILEHHGPRYRSFEDNGYGHLNNGFNFHHSTRFANINMVGAIPGGNYEYYALGYPGFAYFGTNDQSLLVRERRFAPFTMTRARNQVADAIVEENHRLRHGASTMKGMSGGPILRFHNGQIDIIGVVQSGRMDQNFGAKFW